MGSDELARMTLVGLGPAWIARIKELAMRQIRDTTGSIERDPEFREAQRYLRIIADIEREQREGVTSVSEPLAQETEAEAPEPQHDAEAEKADGETAED